MIFIVLAIVLVAVSILNFGITFVKISEYKKAVTGFATAYVNLTVNTNLGLDISPTFGINWSNGSMTAGMTNATLTTVMNSSTVLGGNWSTTGVQGILILNTGNVNASLWINGTKNYTDWFGVTGNQENYTWNVSLYTAGSATCSGGWQPLTTWTVVNHTQFKYCAQFSSLSTANKVWLDVKLQIPSDISSTLTNSRLSDTLTITASTAG